MIDVVLCGIKEESACHLLILCSKVCMLWDLVLALFGHQWVFLKAIREFLLAWQDSRT